MKRLLLCLVLLGAIACESPNTPTDGDTPGIDLSTHALVRVMETGYEMTIPVPLTLAANDTPGSVFNAATGVLEVDAGPTFQLDVVESDREVAEVKAELAEDQLFTWKFQDETDTGFIAQAVLPNGESHYFHMYTWRSTAGRSYLVRSREGQNFTLADVRAMRTAAAAIVLKP